MKRLLLAACAGLLAAAMGSPSLAADMREPVYRSSLGEPVYIAPSAWTGAYIGLNGGYGFGTSNWTSSLLGATTGDFDVSGGLVGGTIGYNMQNGKVVWGIEGDIDAAWMKGSTTTSCGTPGCETRDRWLGTVRGRLGYSMDRWLPYITGGAAFGGLKITPPSGSSIQSTEVGWVLGAGIEYAFLGPWSAKVEYQYVDLGKASCGASVCGTSTDVAFKTSIVKVGLNYRY